MPSSLLDAARQHAGSVGLNLFGLVDARRFDASTPKEDRAASIAPHCGTLLVVGTGGRSCSQQFALRGSACSPAVDAEALHRFVLDGVRRIGELLRAHSIPCATIATDGGRLNFLRLGEAAGFGIVSPVSGLLLHPEYGPWVCVRAALLLDGTPFGPVADAAIGERFQPCCGCARPCVSACPAHVHDGEGNQDLQRCASHRREGNCEDHCISRAACPVGSEHRDGDGECAHRHTYSLGAMQRRFGLGIWRIVPAPWRRRL